MVYHLTILSSAFSFTEVGELVSPCLREAFVTVMRGGIQFFWKKSYDQHNQHVKKERHHFANKGPPSQSYGLSISYVWM